MDNHDGRSQDTSPFLQFIQSSISSKWAEVSNFMMAGNHFIAKDASNSSRFGLISNDGTTVKIFDGKKIITASYFGDDKRLIAYDLRPKKRYMETNGRFFPTPKGEIIITGYYPDYRTNDGRTVFIGPELHFFTKIQRPIDALAIEGKLVHDKFAKRFCWSCGNPVPLGAGPAARYCSEACGLHTRAARDERANTPRSMTCEGCGTGFEATGSGNHRYCCEECKPSHDDGMRACMTCHKLFKRLTNQRYCSTECKPKSEKGIVSCLWCGVSFKRQGPQKYCSNRCRDHQGPRFPLPKG